MRQYLIRNVTKRYNPLIYVGTYIYFYMEFCVFELVEQSLLKFECYELVGKWALISDFFMYNVRYASFFSGYNHFINVYLGTYRYPILLPVPIVLVPILF